jgi:dihydroorotate dehydrogenase (NAD+) catalytic subunit
MDISTSLCGVKLKNPIVLASGILGTNAAILERVATSGAGAVTLKSIGPVERQANNNPSVLAWEHGLINAVGLPSSGYKDYNWEGYDKLSCPLIVSIYGSTVEEYVEVAKAVSSKGKILEINISCPNKHDGMSFCLNFDAVKEVVKSVKKAVHVPVFVKLSPNVPNIGLLAAEVERAGADGITAINTLGPGMIIDIEATRPILAYKTGGLSGPGIKPIAIKSVYDIYKAVKVPIIGTGGITTGRDAIEMLMAGATAVGIGSAVYYHGMDVFKKMGDEMQEWMKINKCKSLKELIGAAHE